jgi:hypothetical protein
MDRTRLALIECQEREGRALRMLDVHAWPLTIGRALDNDLVLDDPCAAAHHARLAPDAQGQLLLQALPGLNGLRVGRRQLAPGQSLALGPEGARLQIGHARLRLRLPGEVLAPERALPRRGPGGAMGLLLVGCALVALQAAGHWIALDPGADYTAWLPFVAGLALGVAGWCGAWALLSKLFQHHFEFIGHLRIALPWLLAIGLVDALWPQIAASLNWPGMWQLGGPLQALLMAALVRAHLALVLPAHVRVVTGVIAVVVLAGGAVSLALTHRSTDSYASAPYMSTLPMPALRLGGTVPVNTLVQAMGPVAQKLAARVKQARQEAQDDGESEPDGE